MYATAHNSWVAVLDFQAAFGRISAVNCSDKRYMPPLIGVCLCVLAHSTPQIAGRYSGSIEMNVAPVGVDVDRQHADSRRELRITRRWHAGAKKLQNIQGQPIASPESGTRAPGADEGARADAAANAQSAGTAVNVLIADDHAIVREGLKHILTRAPDIKVVGEAGNAEEALQAARNLAWDVMVLDYSMPGGDGFSVLKTIKQAFPTRPVLILSVFPEDSIALSALRAGAAGYMNKACAMEELTVAIRKAVSGKKYVSAALAERLAAGLENGAKNAPHESLSDREYRVMWMLANGRTISQIAEELILSPSTVSTYRSRILTKLALDSNASLVRYAIKHGLME